MPFFAAASCLSLLAWFVVFATVVTPVISGLSKRRQLQVLLVPQAFRHVSVLLLMPGFTSETIPLNWVYQTIAGDILTAVVAIVAIAALHRGSAHSSKAVWAASVFGMADLIKNVAYAMFLGVPLHMQVATAIPTMVVPLMFVAHVFAIRVLLRTEPT